VESLSALDADQLTVAEAMTKDPYWVRPDTDLKEIVGVMAHERYGSALVLEGDSVVGIITTSDAIHILWQRLMDLDPAAQPDMRPSAVRKTIIEEHRLLRRRLLEVESLANAVLSGKDGALEPLRTHARALYVSLCEHIELENRILAPALRETAGFGEIRERQLLEHHEQQMRELRHAITDIDEGVHTADALATKVQGLVSEIRVDMAHEDRDLLNPNLLKDDPINVDFSG
jgi:hypothetical protein